MYRVVLIADALKYKRFIVYYIYTVNISIIINYIIISTLKLYVCERLDFTHVY